MNDDLHRAIKQGNIQRVRELVDGGADVEAEDRSRSTPLDWASERGHEAIARLLLDRGANVNTQNEDWIRPLHIASSKGHEPIVRLLLEKGAIVNIKNRSGYTPLYLASREGHEAVVRLLLDRGADMNANSNDGSTPLHLASKGGHEAIARLLLDRGANVNTYDVEWIRPLYLASRGGHEAIVRLLLEKGANVNPKAVEGFTPLHVASNRGHESVVRLLLEKGANVNPKDVEGFTPLHLASMYGHEAVVRLLLEKGADKTIRNREGKTARQVAASETIRNLINDDRKWAGFTQDDMALFRRILDDPQNVSVCPICLNYADRDKGCMYLAHNCDVDDRHEDLYNKYANPARPRHPIEWCTLCGRASEFHRHFTRVAADAPKPGPAPNSQVVEVAQHYQEDCRSVGGGGIEEKVRRFYRLIERAIAFQAEVGKADHFTIRNQLIEDVWNAAGDETIPVADILRDKKFPFAGMDVFPSEKRADVFLDVRRPADEAGLTPIKHEGVANAAIGAGQAAGNECVIEFGPHPDNRPVYQFRHKQPDGSVYDHKNEYICGPDLQIALDNPEKGIQTMCPINPDRCKSKLYPEEIKNIVDPEFFERYRAQFNRVHRVMAGGSRNLSILHPVDMSQAECSLPPRSGGRKKSAKYRRATPHKQGGRKTYRRRRHSRRRK